MRISDWSSDVCSSDLHYPEARGQPSTQVRRAAISLRLLPDASSPVAPPAHLPSAKGPRSPSPSHQRSPGRSTSPSGKRSEEHTSELQSLISISYPVVCLTKKNTTQNKITAYSTTPTHNH